MKTKLSPKLFFLLFSFYFFTNFSYSQNSSTIWHELLTNNRKEANRLLSQIDTSKNLEIMLLNQIVNAQSGKVSNDLHFISNISKFDDYENYLFAHWFAPYVFDDYLENDFNGINSTASFKFDTSTISNSTVKSGLKYMQAISSRYRRDWKQFNEILGSINSIKEWELCGVFENLNSSGIDMPYPPEDEVSNLVLMDTQGRGDASWYRRTDDSEIYNFFTNHSEFGTGVHYAQTFIVSTKKQRIRLKFGKSGLTRLWLNDVMIIQNDEPYITELDALTYEVNLLEGVNRILIKLASDEENPYFIVRLEDLNGNALKNYSVSFDDRKYNKSSIELINPVKTEHDVEKFFENRLGDKKFDQNLIKYSLYLTYLRNGRVDSAMAVIEKWLIEYPNSSFLKSCLAECYDTKGDETSLKKIQSNIKRFDPDYFGSLLSDFESYDELMKLDIATYDNKLNTVRDVVDYPFMDPMIDIMIHLRKNDKQKLRLALDELMQDESLFSSFKASFAQFYAEALNDETGTINVLEKINKSEFNWEALTTLSNYYQKQNRMDDAINLLVELVDKSSTFDNNLYYNLVQMCKSNDDLAGAKYYANIALKNFPNSYLFTKFKAEIIEQEGDLERAIEYYRKALNRNPSNKTIRQKIDDLTKKSNPLISFHLKDAYSYISENRNKIKSNNYGINILLNETNILHYKNGGGEYKALRVYEITSQNGIDILKNHDLGLSGYFLIHKSEIVKSNGEIIPADRNGSKFVFDNLQIGDVIYFDYESDFSSTGRFYKDLVETHDFKGYHPILKNVFRILSHKENMSFKMSKGDVTYKVNKINDLFAHEWSKINDMGLPIQEDYMPPFSDAAERLHISTIDSWKIIAKWYSDIVRKQLTFDATVQNTFDEIFPKGITNMSETKRAERIYNYITSNFNYSFVDFRQSGYVPQKPEKTIKTKLGDCKDFSSLFLVLAQKAELNANLVLILTSDYGENYLLLPSVDFNHCIIKVKLDGKIQYLELTDKYLPFASIPISLRNARALDIPFDSNSDFKSEIYYLNGVQRELAKLKTDAIININDMTSDVLLKTEVSGHSASYYINIFKTKNGKLLDEELQSELTNRSTEIVRHNSLEDFEILNNKITFTSKLNIDLKQNKLGDLFTVSIPHFSIPYNNAIIQYSNRSYPIYYKQYELLDGYEENISIRLKEGDKFIDIPKDISLSYKGHNYSASYNLTGLNVLDVKIKADVNTENIFSDEYQDFKKYVNSVMNERNVIISYKRD